MRLDASLPAGILLAVLSFAGTALAVEPSRHWSFERQDTDDTPAGTLRQEGNISWRGGVKGDAIVFDGYTTALIEDAATVPSLSEGFTVAGWIAVAAYPWAPVPVVNQSADGLSGFSLDVGARGELILRAASDGQWYSLSTALISDDLPVPRAPHNKALFAGCWLRKRSVLRSSSVFCRSTPTRLFNAIGSTDLTARSTPCCWRQTAAGNFFQSTLIRVG